MRARSGSFLLLAIAGALAAGCNGNDVVAGATASPTPTVVPSTPPPSPTPTPEPCKFYGIDSASNLWVIDPVAVTAQMVGPTGKSSMTDIAITPDDHIVGITASGAYELDPSTGHAVTMAASSWLSQQDALDALPGGHLLVGGDAKLVDLDPSTGTQTTVGSIPGGRVFSGDVAASVDGTKALGTAKVTSGTGTDHLVSFDLASHSVVDVGDLGYTKVFGLDYGCDGNLYGMVATSPPKLLRVDPSTAQTTMLGTMSGGPSTLWGAAGPAHP